MNKITDNIWIGNSTDARNAKALMDAGVTAILNCAFDLKDHLGWPDFVISHCGLIDGPGNHIEHYKSAIHQLDALIQSGHKVLVHCHKGHSRSVSVVIMYLDSKNKVGWDYWRSFINEKRQLPSDVPHEAHKLKYNELN